MRERGSGRAGDGEVSVEARFVAALQRLVRARRRDQLTALRQPLDLLIGWGALESPERTRAAIERLLWVMPWLSDQSEPLPGQPLSERQLAEFALVGALFALYSTYRPTVRLASQRGSTLPGRVRDVAPPAPFVSFGATWRRLALLTERDSSDRQFASLLRAPRDDLPRLLRHAIGALAIHTVPVDWVTLLHDLAAWDADDRRVQRAWARDFWRRDPPVRATATAATPPSPAMREVVESADTSSDRDLDEAAEDRAEDRAEDGMG